MRFDVRGAEARFDFFLVFTFIRPRRRRTEIFCNCCLKVYIGMLYELHYWQVL